MSVQARQLNAIRKKARSLYRKEIGASSVWERAYYKSVRAMLTLYHESIRDDVRVRAESLAFLMIFSLMPLIAGGFFIFTIFTQFGMVQDALQSLVDKFLVTIPGDHRSFVLEYILKFKDSYLQTLSHKSGSLGIFALFILIWVGLKTFTNIDRTLNHIWSSERQRPLSENLRNFLMISIVAPLVLTSGLSLPLVLKQAPITKDIFIRFPFLLGLINGLAVPALVIGTFTALYKYVPCRRVKWPSALAGAGFTTVLLLVSNYGMALYFRFGTNSAYGKAAIVPLLGFWIYIVWLIVILGAEVSYLVQNSKDVIYRTDWEPALRDGEAVLVLLMELHRAHRNGKGSVDVEKLRSISGLDSDRLRHVILFLEEKKFLAEVVAPAGRSEGRYVLARDLGDTPVGDVLREFFSGFWSIDASPVAKTWTGSLESWIASLNEVTFSKLAARAKK